MLLKIRLTYLDIHCKFDSYNQPNQPTRLFGLTVQTVRPNNLDRPVDRLGLPIHLDRPDH